MKIVKMNDRELAAVVDNAVADSIVDSGDFLESQRNYLDRYNLEPYGNESAEQSQVHSSDVRDLVEADMPSLARVFLGAGEPVEFRSFSKVQASIDEAKDKQKLVRAIIKTIPNSFRTQHDWLKASELQSFAALEYGVEETKIPRTKRYKGLSEEELAQLVLELENEKGVTKVDIVERDDEGSESEFSVSIRVTHTRKQYFMRNVPIEDMIVSKNAWNKDDADVVGKKFTKTRSQMIAEGFSKSVVMSLASDKKDSDLDSSRYDHAGGDGDSDAYSQANEEISGCDVYMLVDVDGDGIAERRHIIKVGAEILVNEPQEHIPYAIISSMLMPNSIVGNPRSDLVIEHQKVATVLKRELLNNLYAVNHPRTIYNDNVDIDQLLDIRLNGVIHTDGIPQQDIMPLVTPYIGDKALQVVAFMDGQKQLSTGDVMGNQALQADNLHKETATRSQIMETAASARIELVARVVAETGYRDLWEGLAWFAAHYQDDELEQRILGRQMIQDPKGWKYDHHVVALVGTGAGDDEKAMQNLSAIYQVQNALQQAGSPLVDIKKVHNTLANMLRVMGKDSIADYFNDPELPESMVMAERDILKQQVQQMDQALQQANPLAEAEQVKAQAAIQMTQMKQKYESQMDMMKMQQASEQKIMDLQAKFAGDLQKQQIDYQKHSDNMKVKLIELAAKEGNSLAEIQQIMTGLEGMSDEDLFAMASGSR